jgi:hypothetical protein
MKAPYISYSQPDANVAIMQQLKTLFDPKGILNPYKVRYPSHCSASADARRSTSCLKMRRSKTVRTSLRKASARAALGLSRNSSRIERARIACEKPHRM